MYPVHFSISNINCLLITSAYFWHLSKYIISYMRLKLTQWIWFWLYLYTMPWHTHIQNIYKTSNEYKLISLEIFFFGRGWKNLGVMHWTQICRQGVLTSLLFVRVVPPSTVWDLVTGQLAVDAVFTFWATEEITAHCKNRKKLLLFALMQYFFFQEWKQKLKIFMKI